MVGAPAARPVVLYHGGGCAKESSFFLIGEVQVNRCVSIVCLVVLFLVGGFLTSNLAAGPTTAATPNELVATYRTLADAILSAKQTESNLVLSILATAHGHAEAAIAEARAKTKAHQPAKAELERLAALVSQLGNEGDASVAAVRKKLLEGGHHHNASAEQQGIYDEGFVIVTRAAKKVFLEAAGNLGKMSQAPHPAGLEAEWQKVEKQYADLTAKTHR
jgi:hypothetical protein